MLMPAAEAVAVEGAAGGAADSAGEAGDSAAVGHMARCVNQAAPAAHQAGPAIMAVHQANPVTMADHHGRPADSRSSGRSGDSGSASHQRQGLQLAAEQQPERQPRYAARPVRISAAGPGYSRVKASAKAAFKTGPLARIRARQSALHVRTHEQRIKQPGRMRDNRAHHQAG